MLYFAAEAAPTGKHGKDTDIGRYAAQLKPHLPQILSPHTKAGMLTAVNIPAFVFRLWKPHKALQRLVPF